MSYPDEKASKKWSHDGMTFYLVAPDGDYGNGGVPHYCGYVRFDHRPVKEEGYRGILTYVPVHGGITYSAEDKDTGSMVYGFDCGHAGDDADPKMRNEEWLGEECFRMGRAILIAAEYEDRYLLADKQGRAVVLDEYHERLRQEGIDFELTSNFGAMINVMFGDL